MLSKLDNLAPPADPAEEEDDDDDEDVEEEEELSLERNDWKDS